jgi:hypothetical protein
MTARGWHAAPDRRQAGVPLIAVNDVLYHHPTGGIAGRAHLHPRAPDDRQAGRGLRQCRALSQAARRDGAALPRCPEAIEETLALDRALDLLAGRASL